MQLIWVTVKHQIGKRHLNSQVSGETGVILSKKKKNKFNSESNHRICHSNKCQRLKIYNTVLWAVPFLCFQPTNQIYLNKWSKKMPQIKIKLIYAAYVPENMCLQ